MIIFTDHIQKYSHTYNNYANRYVNKAYYADNIHNTNNTYMIKKRNTVSTETNFRENTNRNNEKLRNNENETNELRKEVTSLRNEMHMMSKWRQTVDTRLDKYESLAKEYTTTSSEIMKMLLNQSKQLLLLF